MSLLQFGYSKQMKIKKCSKVYFQNPKNPNLKHRIFFIDIRIREATNEISTEISPLLHFDGWDHILSHFH